MITNITNVVEMGIVYHLVKGEILKKRKNPWIRGFLKYLQEHPKANAEDICRDVFCDNGMARKAAVKNILYFFKQQGLIAYSNSSGYELTQEGLNAFESGSVWQGMKGSFVMTMWVPENSKPFISAIKKSDIIKSGSLFLRNSIASRGLLKKCASLNPSTFNNVLKAEVTIFSSSTTTIIPLFIILY